MITAAMDQQKLHVAILFAGKSAEHEVSIQSAKNVAASLSREKYTVILIGIDREGVWHLIPEEELKNASFENKLDVSSFEKINVTSQKIDVVFPVLHGPFGEDGSIQGFLKLNNLPFVGSGVLGSAVGMDKEISKRLLKEAGLPVAKFLVARTKGAFTFETAQETLGLPLFVKPANMGSSIGVSKVENEEQFDKAMSDAFKFDTKVLLEQGIIGKEVECSVLGNENPQASLPGEIVATKDFYSYEAKYLDENGAVLKIPADLSEEKVAEVQQLAIKAFETLSLNGMARVDFFYNEKEEFFINEVNTIPGFTNISMYPKLWEASGISYSELIDKLIQLALEKYQEEQELQTSL